jgi:hypothetical protein
MSTRKRTFSLNLTDHLVKTYGLVCVHGRLQEGKSGRAMRPWPGISQDFLTTILPVEGNGQSSGIL